MSRSVLGRDPFTRPAGQVDEPPARPRPARPATAASRKNAAPAGTTKPGRKRKRRRRRPTGDNKPATSQASSSALEPQPAAAPPPPPPAPEPVPDLDRVELLEAEPAGRGAFENTWYKSTRLLRPTFYGRWLGRWHLRWHADEVDPFGFDPLFTRRLQPLFDFLFERYWRVEVTGLEHVPGRGRVMLVANHSGTLPWDGITLRLAVEKQHPSHRSTRFLVEDFLFHFPFLGTWLNRIGGVRACQDNARRLLEREQALVVFPEGAKGMGKLYKDRYRLQRFGRGGFVKLAMRTGTPIVPVAVVGAEETHPLLARSDWLARPLGLPYLPITPTFPWLGPLGLLPLPSRWKIVFAPALPVERDPAGAEKPEQVMKLTERVRDTIQEMLDVEISAREA
ncbi:MAG: acyl-phosphate glycerol 3-phosphate acyltransferase [Deltaproteobacteria bacterium]|nr:MAG: acyl-phosphate glycerol 3-phosphate acyltransferase [Deltaproteobacteria bacterium]